MLSLKKIKEKLKIETVELKEFKNLIKNKQRNKDSVWEDMYNLNIKQENYRYLNIAYTLIKKTQKIELLNYTNKELFELVKEFKIENKWNKFKNYYSYYSIPLNISLLKEKLEYIIKYGEI